MLIENKIKINLYRKTSLVRNKKPESLPVRYYVLICFNDMNGCIIFMRRHSQKKKKKVGEKWEKTHTGKSFFSSHCVKYARIRMLSDPYFPE